MILRSRWIAGLMGLILAVAFAVESGTAQVYVGDDENGDKTAVVIGHRGGPGHVAWAREYCDDMDECKIQFEIVDGEQVVIVNGDTVSVDEEDEFVAMLDGFAPRLERFEHDPLIWEGLHGNGFAFLGDREMFDRQRALLPHGGPEIWMDNELRDLEHEARKLARKVRRADDAERAELEAQLDAKLAEIFDYKSAKRQKAIERAQDRLADMQERQEKRASAREDIINQRKRELLGEESYLEW